MPEHEEIEIKFLLDDPDVVRNALVRLGAISHGRRYEMNIRLDDAARSLTERGIVLRLRRIEAEEGSSHLLTIKTPGSSINPLLSVRREIELEVSDGAAMLAGLEVLGYRPAMRYEKRRETFVLGQAEVVIDQMPFGWFLEIEGSEADIRALVGQLGFNLTQGIRLSYSQMFENVRRSLDLATTDLTFEKFDGVKVPPQAYLGG